ncbi:STAS domain-containing protein [Sphaerisporangium dianthi]|uniref:Anti-sigma factor antagonist n=1 Tax=Sphaerisporangium dianthi TaxID=1436120 RepID=A0ABV9CPJ1_9ACTN
MTVIDAVPLSAVPPKVADPALPTTVRLSGHIDIFTSPALRLHLLSVLHTSTSRLILDLSEVTFCDTGGLGVLIGIQRRARARGITLSLTAPRPHMTRLLRSTGLDRRLPMVV